MKILIVHNAYGEFSGEESVVEAQVKLLEGRGHEVLKFERSSAELLSNRAKCKAFFTGIYNSAAVREMRLLLNTLRPDIVHIHNLFPLISPGVLPECRKAGIPVVMTVHNYRLICPNGLHMTGGQICQKCCGGREWWCLLKNCESSFSKSLGYALRNYVARKFRFFYDNVTVYACLTEFQKLRLIEGGVKKNLIKVVPNMCNRPIEGIEQFENTDYIAYAGRISEEKGLPTLFEAMKLLPGVSLKVAGRGPLEISSPKRQPDCEFVGFLDNSKLFDFYRNSKILVFPSIWYETFGLTIVEAMLQGKPVIASRIGGIPEIVEDGVTGLLFEPGNAEDFAEKIHYLWERPDLCRQMGEAGREKALREYSSEKYYLRLMKVYEEAIRICSASK